MTARRRHPGSGCSLPGADHAEPHDREDVEQRCTGTLKACRTIHLEQSRQPALRSQLDAPRLSRLQIRTRPLVGRRLAEASRMGKSSMSRALRDQPNSSRMSGGSPPNPQVDEDRWEEEK